MKKFLAILLAVLMLVMCTACGGKGDNSKGNDSYDPNRVYEVPAAISATDCANPITYFTISLGDNATGEIKSMNAYVNDMSSCDIEYNMDEKKVGKFETEVMNSLTAAFEKSGLAELNGKSVYEEGDAFCSMYISFADGSMVSADFSGNIPQEFTDGYEAMKSYFKVLADVLPKYVPQPVVTGEVDENVYAELLKILNASEMEGIDTYTVSGIALDENFGYTAGLTSNEGIVNGTICAPMMMTNPYSLVIVTVEDKANIEAVRADFESNIDWLKWICVAPSNAVIAQKGDMVLCLIASYELYDATADAMADMGWKDLKEFENPNL